MTERDKQVFEQAGFGERPALLIIDVNYAFCGEAPEPILESIRKWRNSCGEDACFDRSQASHAINLCDINAKYADVIASDEVLAYFDSLPDGQFKLPKGRPPPRARTLAG